MGDLYVAILTNNRLRFSIFSVTKAPSRNIADISADTVALSTNFKYTIPNADGCEIAVTFYKDFAYVTYTKGYCSGIFGFNATVDGYFYKVK